MTKRRSFKKKGPARTRKAKSSAVMMSRAGPAGAIAAAYVDTLNDPFECEGVRLGWGTLVPTNVVSAYLRTTVNANADGSLGLMAVPAASQLLFTNNAGAAVGTWATQAASDVANTNANFSAGRCISIGIKAFPSIAATSAPGASFAGALVGQRYNSLIAQTPNDLEAYPETQMGIGSNGATAVGRPIGIDSFAFTPAIPTTTVALSWQGDDEIPFSIPYVCFEGLPASAPVIVEVVCNFEAIEKETHGFAPLGQGTMPGAKASSHWASIEQLWDTVAPAVSSVAKNTVSTAGNFVGSAVGGLIGSAGGRKAISQGLLAGGNYVGNAIGNTLASFANRQIAMPMGRQLQIANY